MKRIGSAVSVVAQGMRTQILRLVFGVVDLVIPVECAGCARPGTRWCQSCAAKLRNRPHRVALTTDPGIPVFALTTYGGSIARAIIAGKDGHRRDLVVPFSQALAAGITRLRAEGDILDYWYAPLVVVPVPSRPSANRRRGRDHLLDIAQETISSLGDGTVIPAVKTRPKTKDSSGLSAAQRQLNLRGALFLSVGSQSRLDRVRLLQSPGSKAGQSFVEVVIIDDVVTTGATVSEVCALFRQCGIIIRCVLVLAAV